MFLKKFLLLTKSALFDLKYSKTSKIMKYFYYLK